MVCKRRGTALCHTRCLTYDMMQCIYFASALLLMPGYTQGMLTQLPTAKRPLACYKLPLIDSYISPCCSGPAAGLPRTEVARLQSLQAKLQEEQMSRQQLLQAYTERNAQVVVLGCAGSYGGKSAGVGRQTCGLVAGNGQSVLKLPP